jgi:hypothetical protein
MMSNVHFINKMQQNGTKKKELLVSTEFFILLLLSGILGVVGCAVAMIYTSDSTEKIQELGLD